MAGFVIHTGGRHAPGAGAAICRRGHVRHAFVEDPRVEAARCAECGAKVLVACEACGYRIRGAARPLARDYERPSFCDGCGNVFPWAGRSERVRHLQNVVDEEPLDPATRLELQELLGEQLEADPAEREVAWTRILELAPELWTGPGHATLVTLVPAAVKARLGLAA